MVKVVWLGNENRCRDILPYIHTLRLLGLPHVEIIYHNDIFDEITFVPPPPPPTPPSSPLVSSTSPPRIQGDQQCVVDHEHHIVILHSFEDCSYGNGSWGWDHTPKTLKSISYEQIKHLIQKNTTLILIHSDDSTQPLDPRILNLAGVYVEKTYSDVINRIITDCINSNEIEIPDVSLPIPSLSLPLSSPNGASYSSLPLVKRIVFVRHAQRLDEVFPEWSDMAERPQDTPLTAMGIQQSQYLGKWLSQQSWCSDIGAFFVSPFVRTVQTAHFALNSMISASSTSPPLSIPLNIEYGLSEGAAWMSNNNQCRTPWHLKAADLYCISTDINLKYQSLKVPNFQEGPTYPGRPIETELWYDRCAQTIWRLVRMTEHTNQTIVIVTHAGCVGLLVHSLSGRALPMVGHTAVTSLVLNQQTARYEIEGKGEACEVSVTGEATEGEAKMGKGKTVAECQRREIFVQQDHLPEDMRTGFF
jgi:broad specificity phosphatase PhoE